jgi:hypothetical protein
VVTPTSAEAVCRPAIAYFPQYDRIYAGLFGGDVNLRSLPVEFRSLCWGLSTDDQRRFERTASREEALLVQGVRHLQANEFREALDALRRSERMWTDNAIVHEALLRVTMRLNLGIEALQERLFAAARTQPALGLAQATVSAFGPSGSGDTKTALNALKLLCGTEPADHPSRSAILSLALDAHRCGEAIQPIFRLITEQMELALSRNQFAPDELTRLADAAYVADVIGGDMAERYGAELNSRLDLRYTGLWSDELDMAIWKPDGVVLTAEPTTTRQRGLLSAFRR